MSFQPKWLAWTALLYCAHPTCRAQAIKLWSEAEVIEQFQTQSPQARELRARVAVAEADARARTVLPNPAFSYSLEGAGYNAFFEFSQILPVSGRIHYLREAGAAAVSAADANREAALWSLRSDLRVAFYRMVAAQAQANTVSTGAAEVDQLIRLLRKREEEGEGSRYDRIRAERELTELRIDLTGARSQIAAAGARLSAFLPEGTPVRAARGELGVPAETPGLEVLVRVGMNARADYRAEQRSVARYQIEEQAARRLRIPEPLFSAGLKRAEEFTVTPSNQFSNPTKSGIAFGVSIPLPILNKGQYEVARYRAEQGAAAARLAVLAHQIHTEIEGALNVVDIRRDALAAYQHELESAGTELTRITRIAYQEGEVGILELLDSLRISRTANLRLLELQASLKEAFIELERVVGEEIHP